MPSQLPKLIATSVVRGAQKGNSHGGVFLIDLTSHTVEQKVDWDTVGIDFSGRGWDRGLRGIEYDGDDVYIAASDELFVFDTKFTIRRSFRNQYLRHCHEIFRRDRSLFLTSTGFDSVLEFDIDKQEFVSGYVLVREGDEWALEEFDPRSASGPAPTNNHHLNNVYVEGAGLFVSGLRTLCLLRIEPPNRVVVERALPKGIHNARPYRGGVLFNDSGADQLRYLAKDGRDFGLSVPTFDPAKLTFLNVDPKLARPGFARGLCLISDALVAGGSSPSTISIYDIDSLERLDTINFSCDVRNAIHGLEVWPFAD